LSPDTIVPEPGNPQALNRYTYANNSPRGWVDPAGHAPEGPCSGASIPDCGVDGWYGYEDWEVKLVLDPLRQ